MFITLDDFHYFLLVSIAFFCYFIFSRPKGFPPGPPIFPVIGSIPFIRLPFYRGITYLAEKYGDIFGAFVGSYPVVVLNDPDLIRRVYGEAQTDGRPALPFFEDRSFGIQRGVIFGNGPTWTEQRLFTFRHLRNLGMKKMETKILAPVIQLRDEWKKAEPMAPFSIVDDFRKAGMSIIWSIVSRHSSEDLLLKAVDPFYKLFEDVEEQGPFLFLPWTTKIAPKLTGWQKTQEDLDTVYDIFRNIVAIHRENLEPGPPTDFVDAYLQRIDQTKDPGSTFFGEEGEKQLLVVLFDLFSVSTDGVSLTLEWACLFLILNRDIQKRLQTEIDRVVGQNRIPSLSDRPKMPYMEAFIAETLRTASHGTIFPHAVNRTYKVRGYTIPKGTAIIGNFWKVHHDPKYWGDPSNFRPERFLDEDGSYRKNENLMPFSTGGRICPGESIARDQVFLFLSCLLQAFDFESTGEKLSVDPRPSAIMPRAQPFEVIVRSRVVELE